MLLWTKGRHIVHGIPRYPVRILTVIESRICHAAAGVHNDLTRKQKALATAARVGFKKRGMWGSSALTEAVEGGAPLQVPPTRVRRASVDHDARTQRKERGVHIVNLCHASNQAQSQAHFVAQVAEK